MIKFSEAEAAAASAPPPLPPALFSGFFNAKGRVLFDAFIVPATPPVPEQAVSEFFVDCAAAAAPALLGHLNRYKLRSPITIDDASADYRIWSVLGDASSTSSAVASGRSFVDPRLPALGRRLILPADVSPPGAETTTPIQVYHAHRMLHGVPEGPKELVFEDTLPLEANLDLLHGISFEKGCYLGQELTARVHHTGVIRKRLLPVVRAPADAQLPLLRALDSELLASYETPQPLRVVEEIQRHPQLGSFDTCIARAVCAASSAQPLGSILNACGNIAIAMLRIEPLLAGERFLLEGDSSGDQVIPLIPPYLKAVLQPENPAAAPV
jgi:folate-binding protein YgfZ